MKINFTLFGAGLTGGTFNIVEPANRLAERGHDVTVLSIGNPGDLDWFYKNRQVKFKPIFAPLTGKFVYRLFRRLTRGTKIFPMPEAEIRDLISVMPDCDVNIATVSPTAFAVHRSGKGRGFYYIQHYDSLFGKNTIVNKMHDESYFLPLSKITVSSWLARTIRDRLNVEIKTVINAGVDGSIFHPTQKVAGKKKRIISLGRKVDWKGFGELRVAMCELFRTRNDIEWVVYSSHDTPASAPDAPFTLIKSPYGKALADLYGSCDIAVNPSWHEGFAQPALEAMACGCAVVTTPVGAEDFAADEKNCIMVPPKNPEQIKNALVRLLDDDVYRQKIAAAGAQTGLEFSWDKIIDKWEAVLSL